MVDVLTRALGGVAPVGDGFLSEAALAAAIGASPRRLQVWRRAGIFTPRRQGRGNVYDRADARAGAVAAALERLGAPAAAIADLIEGHVPCRSCPTRGMPDRCGAHACCAAFLAELMRRTQSEIGDLRAFETMIADRVGGRARRTA